MHAYTHPPTNTPTACQLPCANHVPLFVCFSVFVCLIYVCFRVCLSVGLAVLSPFVCLALPLRSSVYLLWLPSTLAPVESAGADSGIGHFAGGRPILTNILLCLNDVQEGGATSTAGAGDVASELGRSNSSSRVSGTPAQTLAGPNGAVETDREGTGGAGTLPNPRDAGGNPPVAEADDVLLGNHLLDFWTNICICHSLIVEKGPDGGIVYQVLPLLCN